MEDRSDHLSAPARNPRPLSMIVPPLVLNHASSLDDNVIPPSRRRRSSACRPAHGGDLILPPIPVNKRVDLSKDRPASTRVSQRSSTPLFKVVNDWKDKRTKKKKRSETVATVALEDKTTPFDRKRVLVRQPSMSDPNLRGKLPPELLLTSPSPVSTSDPMSTVRIADSPKTSSPTTIASPYQSPNPTGSQTLSTLKKMADKLEGEERDLLVAALVATHERDPISLFEECLRDELASDPQMETLMRLTCPSVCVLHAITKPFRDRLTTLVTPLIDLAATMTQNDINSLTPSSAPSSPLISTSCFSPTFPPSSPSQFLRSAPESTTFTSSSDHLSPFSCSSPPPSPPSISSALRDCIASLLSPSSFLLFPLIHTLSYRATQVVKETIGGEEEKIHRWAITAVLFLRYIVPLVIQSSSSSPGPRFVGKLLMKMCTESTFTTDSSCLADHLLSSLSPLFSNFCDQMVEMGEQGQAKSEEKKEKQKE